MEGKEVEASESSEEQEDNSSEEESSLSARRDVYLPGLSRPLMNGEKLIFDKSAYEMYHKFHTGIIELLQIYPCLSFEPLTFDASSSTYPLEFPFHCSLVAGTQAAKPTKNAIILMQLQNLNRFSKRRAVILFISLSTGITGSGDESSSSEEDEESFEDDDENNEPYFKCAQIPHHGDINRIRTTYIHDTLLCATWNATGKVHIWNLSPAVKAIETMDIDSGVVTLGEKDVFTFTGHLVEGFAMDWSTLTPGRLATGDCRANIHLWKLVEGGTWQVDQRAFKKHEGSVEDIRWSKSENNVFFSCSSDKSIKIWDARAKPENACIFDIKNAHDSDVNVIDVSSAQQLLISGDDDGAVKIWDLRAIQDAKPVALFKYHQGPINSVEWYPYEKGVFAVSSEDNVVTLWDLTADTVNAEENENVENLPPQLLFIHLGLREVKEVHWHPNCKGVFLSTALNGFDVAKTISV
ncbi:glutamate rich WD repeat containing protein [Trichuris trichiura]|uniref:Glutamate-rich WD repeat-containing protein 1 n=1 Tax=Trichuris trichiura TaxID=36087 RepID=A0A077YZP9_TRITR|nr:glutamate rich WD repeat containing protein [Trichuris trichiura]